LEEDVDAEEDVEEQEEFEDERDFLTLLTLSLLFSTKPSSTSSGGVDGCLILTLLLLSLQSGGGVITFENF
jgi:hypothetical protein